MVFRRGVPLPRVPEHLKQAEAVPEGHADLSSVVTKLAIFTLAMVLLPIGTYYLTRDFLFGPQNLTYPAIAAVTVANLILTSPSMPSLPPPRPPNPSSFRVATSSHPRSHQTDSADLSSFHSSFLSRALSSAGPSSLALRLSWIERLSNPEGVGLEELREAAAVLDRASWEDLLEERWTEGRCPYPTCSRPAGEPYRAPEERSRDEKRLRVRMRANGLYEAPRRDEGKGAPSTSLARFRRTRLRATTTTRASFFFLLLETVPLTSFPRLSRSPIRLVLRHHILQRLIPPPVLHNPTKQNSPLFPLSPSDRSSTDSVPWRSTDG
uniref:BY PROTMAP: gi/342320338/gb/EGU12279.1/ Voltage gated chloride channel domain-containing protein [Rhodotorula glutinis ATCC 204091] n=1 Tax=Rhodotorula toruloides TaxID=5286 RepID=A0A0K3CW03_RHOTO